MADEITYPSRVDRPYRAAPDRGTVEDNRRAMDRTNERIDQLVTRVKFLEANQAIGIGGMNMATPQAGDDLGAGWDVVDEFDTVTIPPVNMTLDTVGGLFRMNEPGVWQVAFSLTMTHNELNAGRDFDLRLFAVSIPLEIGRTTIGVARNVGTTNINAVMFLPITEQSEDRVMRFELGNGDTFTTVFYENLSFTALKVSN